MDIDFKKLRDMNRSRSCACIGPQNGQPYCPCRMEGLIQRGGQWIEPERVVGPVLPPQVNLTLAKQPWECPRCKTINGPNVERCDCAPDGSRPAPSPGEAGCV